MTLSQKPITSTSQEAVDKAPAAPEQDPYADIQTLDDPRLYFNRELSLVEFQRRVLEEALDPANPLLERFKFLSIVGSNIEEMFMVRIAGLKRQVEAGTITSGPDGLRPVEQIAAIREEVMTILDEASQHLTTELLPALKENRVIITSYDNLADDQRASVQEHFMHHIFPVLTPLAFDPGHPFPHISNLSLNLAVIIRDTKGEERFARVKVPDTLPQLIRVNSPPKTASGSPRSTTTMQVAQCYVWLSDVIGSNLEALFPGMQVLEVHPFHVTRDGEIEIQEWEAEDLLETTEQGIRQRRFGDVVKLTVDDQMPERIIDILISNLEIDPDDVYRVEGRFPLSDLKHIYALDIPNLKDQPFLPSVPAVLNPDSQEQEEDIFASIRRRDILLHHPFDSFQPVVHLLDVAAKDPSVLAIKMTLYRVGKNSPVVECMLDAMEHGKQVAVLVELKARFDEESNIEWAKALERVGVHVVYGLIGLKIHSKIALIVRKEGDLIRRYVHLGTGNYNPVTAHLYTDLGLLTCDEEIGSDITDLFNYLTGYSAKRDYRKIWVAPINARERFESLVRREIEHQQKTGRGHLIFKMNALSDESMIKLLYEASQAGVKIDLLVRGICCLRPGIKGISDNIRVISIVGRFLEHSRIFYFHNGGKEEIYMGSADLMPRNLYRRVEVVFPVEDQRLASYLRDEVLATYLADCIKARYMQPDGHYTRCQHVHGDSCVHSQTHFIGRKKPWDAAVVE